MLAPIRGCGPSASAAAQPTPAERPPPHHPSHHDGRNCQRGVPCEQARRSNGTILTGGMRFVWAGAAAGPVATVASISFRFACPAEARRRVL